MSLLVLVGVPGGLANGTNRVGILVQNVAATWRFRAEGVSGIRGALPLLLPVALGSVIGAYAITTVSDAVFERVFGVLMVLLLVPVLWNSHPRERPDPATPRWPAGVTFAAFFAIGVYGGAFQGGVGIPLVFALSYAGHDLVRANSIKVVIILVLVATAVPVFWAKQQIDWPAAASLSAGFLGGGALGARLAVRGGERLIRPVLAVTVLALAGRMLRLY